MEIIKSIRVNGDLVYNHILLCNYQENAVFVVLTPVEHESWSKVESKSTTANHLTGLHFSSSPSIGASIMVNQAIRQLS